MPAEYIKVSIASGWQRSRQGERLETRKTPQANYILGVCSHVQGGRIQYEDKFVPPWLTRHCVNITQEVFGLAVVLH